jgi:hypothetical protein
MWTKSVQIVLQKDRDDVGEISILRFINCKTFILNSESGRDSDDCDQLGEEFGLSVRVPALEEVVKLSIKGWTVQYAKAML